MDSNGAELVALGDRLFSKKHNLDSLHQNLAEQFYPERANFTVSRVDGTEYAENLYESGPAQARRDLSGAIGAILRPRGKEWFKPIPADDWRKTNAALQWCDFARDVMRRQLYTARSKFQKTMADGDDDFVAFGNSVTILTEAPDRHGFLFELSHLRDNAWTTDRYGDVDVNHRKLKMTLRAVVQKWGEKALTKSQLTTMEKSPYEEIEIRHICMPAVDYDPYLPKSKWKGKPWASVYINPEGKHVIHEGGYFEFPYIHRRWRVPDDSVYGYSPAAMLGLVDARVLQSQARVILDAGELRVAPPLLAKRDAVLGGVNNYAGAVTWLDIEYDERFGDAIRPLDTGGDVRLGLDMKIDTRNIVAAAWYLNKLNLPSDANMTAYEVSERVAEYIRSAGPIFEPFEADNARILDIMFAASLRLGYFGPIKEIPREIIGDDAELKWEFDTPVQQAYQRMKAVKARETFEMVSPIAQAKPEVMDHFDWDRLTRDTAQALGGEAGWLKPVELVAQERAERAEQMAKMQEMEEAKQAMDLAEKAGSAGQKMSAGMQNLPQTMAQMQQLLANGQGPGAGDDIPWPDDPAEGDEAIDMEGLDLEGLDLEGLDLEGLEDLAV